MLPDPRAPTGPDWLAAAARIALLTLACGCTDLDALRALAHGGEMGGRDGAVDDAGPRDAGRDAGARDAGPTPDAGRDAGPHDGEMPCELLTFYRDADEDGFGDPDDTTQSCEAPTGYVAVDGDCDDACPSCFEGGSELCGNSSDDDCDSNTDESPGTAQDCSACGAACAGALACNALECEQPAAQLELGDGKSCAFVGALSALDAYAADCWGNNAANELRLGSAVDNVARPTNLAGGDFRDVAVGNDFVCTLDDASDEITCTGGNGSLQLGTSASVDTHTFVHSGTVAISAVFNQACLLTNAGQVHCWGAYFTGDRPGAGTAYPTRQLDLGGATAVEVSAGSPIGCVRLTSGQVQCWGPLYAGDAWVPHAVLRAEDAAPLAGVVQVVTNGADGAPAVHACARLDTGRVACWGVNFYGELGNGASGAVSFQETASTITGNELASVIDVSVGMAHSCALASTGQVYCWGDSKSAFGSGTDPVVTPTAVAGLDDVIDIASGSSHNCARRRSGQVVCWGYNFHGELGDDTTLERTTVRNVYGLP